jgi:hypothetical protein
MACINASVLFDNKFYKIMTRLDYNEDGFFQNEYSSRGERYDNHTFCKEKITINV